jgi:glycerol-1-phosphate dehydrogenase [NAD(P)+]
MKLDLLSQSLKVPFAFELSDKPDTAFPATLRHWNFLSAANQKILFVTGSSGPTASFVEEYQARLSRICRAEYSKFNVAAGSQSEVREIVAVCAERGVSVLVAIGGGRVIDVAKAVVNRCALALIAIPTVLSSDGIASPVSVLLNEHGFRESTASGLPSCLFIDLTRTVQAPVKLTRSGVGDVVSNASALLDLADYEENSQILVNGFAKILSTSAYTTVCQLTPAELTTVEGHRSIAMSLILSGLAMAFAGNSLPCSGGEHLISHAIDRLGFGEGTHGMQVALATVYCDALRGVLGRPRLGAQMIPFIRKIGLPTLPCDIGITQEQFIQAVLLAPQMRVGRTSVLNYVTASNQLFTAYEAVFQ